ncbi:MAG: NAD(P)H-quinone oxidoreductase [Betaproteobacteria bacterium]
MKAIEITKPGDADVLMATSRPVPTPKNSEVLIKVRAAGVNRPDVMQRAGLYPPPKGASDIPGLEVAGTIVAAGNAVTGLQVNQSVCALVAGGGYAEYVTAPATQCLPIPNGLSIVEAASLPETYFTVWSNVFDRARLTEGETILVHGGSSGIGTTAIQLCSALGFDVLTTAGTEEKCQICEELGAKKSINYRTEEFSTSVKSITNQKGVDVILDMVAGDYLQRNLECLADDGRLVIIAFLGGVKTTINMTDILRRRLTVTGSTLRPRSEEFKQKIAVNLLKYVWPLIENKQIKPLIYRSFALEDAAQAHRLMESSVHIGKIVLEVNSEDDRN